MKDIIQLIEEKSIILRGGTPESRKARIKETADKLSKKGWSIFLFPEGASGEPSKENFKKIVPILPITSPLKNTTKWEMNFSQLDDYFLEWVYDHQKVVIIFNEISPRPLNKFWEWFQLYLDKTIITEPVKQPPRKLRILVSLAERIELAEILEKNHEWRPMAFYGKVDKDKSVGRSPPKLEFNLSDYLEIIS